MNKKVFEEIEQLQEKYELVVPECVAKFISVVNKYEYAGVELEFENEQLEFNSFIVCDSDEIYGSLLRWYVMNRWDLPEFLVFAFGGYNDSFAIKAKGEDLGKIYHVDSDNDEIRVRLFCESFERFIEILKNNKRGEEK